MLPQTMEREGRAHPLLPSTGDGLMAQQATCLPATRSDRTPGVPVGVFLDVITI